MLSLKNGWLILGHTPAARPGLSVFVFSREGEIALISSEGKKKKKRKGKREGEREMARDREKKRKRPLSCAQVG